MNFFPDFAPNSRKEWRLLLFRSNLRKQIRKLPKILKFVRIIHYYSLTGVVSACTVSEASCTAKLPFCAESSRFCSLAATPVIPAARRVCTLWFCDRSPPWRTLYLCFFSSVYSNCWLIFGKLWEARSRLYRRRFLQVNTCWKALAEIYTMHSFAPFSNLNFFVKNRQNFFAIELMNIH